MAFHKIITKQLAAAVSDGVALSQAKGSAGNLTINGSLASGGVATFDTGRRVLVTSGGNDSGITFTITGTGNNGFAQTEVLAGTNGSSAYTTHDFKTVTSVAVSGAVATAVTVGTNGVGSSEPWIVDTWVNPPSISAATTGSTTTNYSLQVSYNSYAKQIPAWDLNANSPTWWDASGWSALTGTQNGIILETPITMLRLTINSGTEAITATLNQAFIAGS